MQSAANFGLWEATADLPSAERGGVERPPNPTMPSIGADDADQLIRDTDANGASASEERVIKVGDAIELITFGKFQRRVLWAAGLCFTADATEVMLLSFLSLTLQSEWGLTATQTATITSCVFAGALAGTLTLGYLGDTWGRRPAYLLSSAIISLFGVLTAFATGYASLLGIRFMVGFGVGGLTGEPFLLTDNRRNFQQTRFIPLPKQRCTLSTHRNEQFHSMSLLSFSPRHRGGSTC